MIRFRSTQRWWRRELEAQLEEELLRRSEYLVLRLGVEELEWRKGKIASRYFWISIFGDKRKVLISLLFLIFQLAPSSSTWTAKASLRRKRRGCQRISGESRERWLCCGPRKPSSSLMVDSSLPFSLRHFSRYRRFDIRLTQTPTISSRISSVFVNKASMTQSSPAYLNSWQRQERPFDF